MRDWDDISEEISQHLHDRYHELRARGFSHDDARASILAEADDPDLVVSLNVARRDVASDVRYACRMLRRNFGVAAVIVLTLALGIGANAAVFSVVNAILLRPLPYRDADRLVVIWDNLTRHDLRNIEVSALEYTEFRDRNRVFDSVAAYSTRGFNVSGDASAERLDGAEVTATLFPALGVTPILGRTFTASDEQPDRERVIVSHDVWQRQFGGHPSIVGRIVNIDSRPAEVVGVMPAGFHFPGPSTDIWTPVVFDAELLSENNRGSRAYSVIARLKPNVSQQQALAAMRLITDQMSAEHPDAYRGGYYATVRPLKDEIVGDTSRALFVQLGAVALVLLIACVNVANLLLARSASRKKEVAIRVALGARRSRIVRQLLTESVVLASFGALAGLALAFWTVELLVAIAPPDLPRVGEISLDLRVVAFTALIGIVTGVLFGLAPALHAARADPADSLKDAARPGAAGSRRTIGNTLIVSEIALALVLVVAAALLVSSFARLQNVDPGFVADRLLTLRIAPAPARYATFDRGLQFYDALFATLRAIPGVRQVGGINALPMSGYGGDRTFYLSDRDNSHPENAQDEQLRFAMPGYFGAMGIPLLSGREFSDRDTLASPRVVVVNDAFARKFWPDGSAIGKRITFNLQEPAWYEIVGVSGSVKHHALDAAVRPEIYVPYAQPLFAGAMVRPMFVVIRTAGDPLSFAATVRERVAAVDRDQPISNVRSMEQRLGETLAPRRFNMAMLALFALVAVLLAAVGVYGIVSYAVTERSREIGVRLALGAEPVDVLALVLRYGLTLAVAGAVIGLLAAIGLTRVMSSLLFGTSPTDPLTLAVAVLSILAAAFAACVVPARRAARLDPLAVIRSE